MIMLPKATRVMSDRQPIALVGHDGLELGAGRETYRSTTLSEHKKEKLKELIKLFPTLGEAYRLKELFNDLWEMETEEEAICFIKEWCDEAGKLNTAPFNQFIKTVKAHWSGIVNFCETEINNGILEGINNKVQLAKRRARGYRCTKNFINMIYFLCGKLRAEWH